MTATVYVEIECDYCGHVEVGESVAGLRKALRKDGWTRKKGTVWLPAKEGRFIDLCWACSKLEEQ